MPLKAIVRGHSYAVVPISWRHRTHGQSKLGLKEMGSRYLFSLLYVFLEHHLTRGDYRRPGSDGRVAPAEALTPPVTLTELATTFPLPATTSALDELEFTTISPLAVTRALVPAAKELGAAGSRVCTRAWSTLIVTIAVLPRPATLVAEHESVVPAVYAVRVTGPQPEDEAMPE